MSETAGGAGGRPSRRRTLAGRVLLASSVLAVLVVSVFALLVVALSALRDSTQQEAHAKDVTAAALVLERIVLDLETGLRGLVISKQVQFLRPWTEARKELPEALTRFRSLTEGEDNEQRRRARLIDRQIRAYVVDYSQPLVEIARENPAEAGTLEAVRIGRGRVQQIRGLIGALLTEENRRSAASAAAAERQSDRAVVLGVGGLVASGLLIALFGAYLARSIGRPVQEAADGAARLADGDLSLRLAEGGPGEIGELTRSFNAMAERLELSRRELQEQNEQLRESERLKSELVGIVSHEVRTPLASVLGFTSLLLNRAPDDETRRRYLEIVDTQARRLASLLDDFLDLQRVEEGRLQLVEELIDMAGLLREQVQLFTAPERAASARARRRRRSARRSRRCEPARPGRRQPALERDQVLAGGRPGDRPRRAARRHGAGQRPRRGTGDSRRLSEPGVHEVLPRRGGRRRHPGQRPRACVLTRRRRGARRHDGLRERSRRGLDVLGRSAGRVSGLSAKRTGGGGLGEPGGSPAAALVAENQASLDSRRRGRRVAVERRRAWGGCSLP